jgi:phage-related protein (TIGR01555 family)
MAKSAKAPKVEPIVERAKKRVAVKDAMATLDRFVNEITGAGTDRSKLTHGIYQSEPLLSWPQLEALFKDNDLARKIVAKPVDDALRAGFNLRRKDSTPEKDQADSAKLLAAYAKLTKDRLGGDKLKRAAVAARLHGGGGLILGALAGAPVSEKLEDENVTELNFVVDWDRREMTATDWYVDGTPKTFDYTATGGKSGQPAQRFHESRLLFFPGALTTNEGRRTNQDWDHSVLQAVYQALHSFDQMFSSTDAMFANASQAIFKLQGLIQALAEADGEGIEDAKTRLALLDMMRSAFRAVFLEAGGGAANDPEEKFELVESKTLGTLDKVIQQYYVRLAAAAGMPLTVLLGMAPAGMDATGESDMILYYNSVDVYRKEALAPQILRIIKMLHRSEKVEGDAEDWELVWPELQRPKPVDIATAEKMAIDACVALVTAQVVLPEEVALSLRIIAPMLGIVIDAASREKALKAALAEVEKREMTGPAKEEEPLPGAGAPTAKSSERKTPAKTAKRQT